MDDATIKAIYHAFSYNPATIDVATWDFTSLYLCRNYKLNRAREYSLFSTTLYMPHIPVLNSPCLKL